MHEKNLQLSPLINVGGEWSNQGSGAVGKIAEHSQPESPSSSCPPGRGAPFRELFGGGHRLYARGAAQSRLLWTRTRRASDD